MRRARDDDRLEEALPLLALAGCLPPSPTVIDRPANGASLQSPGKARSLCDIAPSRFARIGRDGYFTIDADWIVPALCRALRIEAPIYEPCAGRGHLVVELRSLGFVVDAADLYAHENPLVPDIVTGADVFDVDALSGYRTLITNLPYESQDAILAHLLPIAARDGCTVATLARSEWASARERHVLVHDNPRFAGEVRLTKRPVWIRPMIASPRHNYSWFIWAPQPRTEGRDVFLRFTGEQRNRSAKGPAQLTPEAAQIGIPLPIDPLDAKPQTAALRPSEPRVTGHLEALSIAERAQPR
jgi:hypothetical protein